MGDGENYPLTVQPDVEVGKIKNKKPFLG